jgi:hypothetical protein
MVATEGVLLLQVPPDTELDNKVDEPAGNDEAPVMTPGNVDVVTVMSNVA